MRLLVDEVALGQGFLLVLLLSPVSIIPPMFHTRLHEHAALTGRRNVLRLRNVPHVILVSAVGKR